ncbi:unnamed protein product [Dracunculus medinensis]|uniref:Brain protein I3 n=1 Tax=Dracunculus medinensis TaxID=318479 RepID=A0A0N4UJG9_DRAME|nr:unnamed protein product [Dracunculus medinensis]
MSTTKKIYICPNCKVDSIKKQFTWKGVLYGILCFPCGLYCCLKSYRQQYCPLCELPLSSSAPLKQYRFYKSTQVNSKATESTTATSEGKNPSLE